MKPIALFLLYGLTAFLGVFGPSVIKMMLMGHAGVNTDIFGVMVAAPGLFLLLGHFLGRRAFTIHAVLLWAAGAWSCFLWINRDLMSPWKEFAHAQSEALVGVHLIAWLLVVFALPRVFADK